jgi:hypothetical protein
LRISRHVGSWAGFVIDMRGICSDEMQEGCMTER